MAPVPAPVLTAVADTVYIAAQPGVPIAQVIGQWVAIAGVGLAATLALLRAGVMVGRHQEFRDSTNARLEKLEASDNAAITRDELDARFAELRAEIGAIKDRLGDLLPMLREALKK